MTDRIAQMKRLLLEGSQLLESGDAAGALHFFNKALDFDELNPVLNLHAGAALHELKRFGEAVDCYVKALRIDPQIGEAHNNMGNSLMAMGRFEDAAESFVKAATLLPGSPVPLAALGSALQSVGRVKEAEEVCRRGVAIAPDFAEAHWNLALNLLLQGRYSEGWPEYEWRWRKPDFTSPRRHFDVPLWDGSPLQGRTILLHAEQGFGDAIQFVRYAPLVAEMGGKVILECHPQLVSLFRHIEGVISVVAFGEQLPEFQCQAPFLFLPRILATTLLDIPVCPCFSVPDERSWERKIKHFHGPKVGIVWAGSTVHRNDRARSLPADFVPSITGVTGITFFSLQMGRASEQTPLPAKIVDLTGEIFDFLDTAAFIMQLDLVISVDTAVAHLAGALGKPVWLLLPFAPDWRWLLEREDSPWYPSMRIFRQESPGEWEPVVKRVVHFLKGGI